MERSKQTTRTERSKDEACKERSRLQGEKQGQCSLCSPCYYRKRTLPAEVVNYGVELSVLETSAGCDRAPKAPGNGQRTPGWTVRAERE